MIRGSDEASRVITEMYANAKRTLDSIAGPSTPSHTMTVEGTYAAYADMKSRGVKVRAIIPVGKENIELCKRLVREGLVSELRHLEGIKGDFAVSESEYIAASEVREGSAVEEVIHSNDPGVVSQNHKIFDTLWASAMPAELRFKMLDEGREELGGTRVTYSTDEIYRSAADFVAGMREEALIVVPFGGSTRSNAEFFKSVVGKAKSTQTIRVKILGRFSEDELPLVRELATNPGVEVRSLASERQVNLALGIYDRKGMGIVQAVYPDEGRPLSGPRFLSGVISTNKQVVSGMAAIFDSLWEESEIREKEMRNRSMAELLQDILAHDITNYNQIVLLNAEMLRRPGEMTPEETSSLVEGIVAAIEKSTALIERAKRLGRALTRQDVDLLPTGIEESIERSVSVVRSANPTKKIVVKGIPLRVGRSSTKPKVLADEMLDEVFTNVLSNSVRYTRGDEVVVEVGVTQEGTRDDDDGANTSESYSSPSRSWRISIADEGVGIPDEVKTAVFTRYHRVASGSGLGLSIVRALVTERYRGRVSLRDRVEGDHAKGTVVEIWIPEAPPA